MRRGAVVDMKDKARAAVNRAIRRGEITRPELCSECGAKPERGSDGRSCIHAHHHKGYEHPLDVEWLCPKCHFKHDPRPSGARNGRAVLTPEAVAYIRTTKRRTFGLAKRFGVDATTISRAREGRHWIDAAKNGA